MRHRAHRPLHVLLCAPVIALAAVVLAPSAHALAAVASLPAGVPSPVSVVLDPGHGGSPDNQHPDQPWDPGAIGANGLLEKDIVLDVARRVQVLLGKDDVAVTLTRTTDVYMDIPSRTQVAVDQHCDVFTSIHMNGFADPAARGSVVLFPDSGDQQFATGMAGSLDAALSRFGVSSRGVMLRDNWWIHVPCPAVTVEPVFITNPDEAGLMARGEVRDALAAAISAAIERQDPEIAARKPALEAYRAQVGGHLPWVAESPPAVSTLAPVSVPAGVATPPDSHADPTPAAGPSIRSDSPTGDLPVPWRPLLVVIALGAAVLMRGQLLHGAAVLSAAALGAVSRIDGHEPPSILETFSGRRRRLARRRRLLARSRRSSAGRRAVPGRLWD